MKILVNYSGALKYLGAPEGREYHAMTRAEAEKYIANLPKDKKRQLNEMLKALEQKRPLSPVPPASTGKGD